MRPLATNLILCVICKSHRSLSWNAGQPEASRIAAQMRDLNLRGEPEQPSTPSQMQETAIPVDPAVNGEQILERKWYQRHRLQAVTL